MSAKVFHTVLATALVSGVVAACSSNEGVRAREEPSVVDDWRPHGDELGDGPLGPKVEGRMPRRLSVAQLEQTLIATFGASWGLDVPNTNPPARFELLPILAPALGQPDYLTENVESLEPTPLFAKFMDNMAARVCLDAVLKDTSAPLPAKPVIVRYPDDVDRNLRYLRLRLHGIWVADGSTVEIKDLRALYQSIADNAEPNIPPATLGWLGVCIAMVTAPEFMTY